jgi:hypothetical protein
MVLLATVVFWMTGSVAPGMMSVPTMTPAVVGGPLVAPQLLPPYTLLFSMDTAVTTSLGAWAWTMIPPSYDPLTLLVSTWMLLTVAAADAVATTMPP